MLTLKNNSFYFMFLIITIGCSNKKEKCEELEIRYLKSTIYLKESKNIEAESPPILHLEFSVENFTDFEKVLPLKSSKFDKQKSTMFILDTINNKVLPLYSGDVVFLKPNSKRNFKCEIKLIKHNGFFNIDAQKLKPRLGIDYSDYEEYFEDKCNYVLKNAILCYVHDSTDVDNNYTLQNNKVTGFKDKTIVYVKK